MYIVLITTKTLIVLLVVVTSSHKSVMHSHNVILDVIHDVIIS
jgi:hypothetical protein